MKELQEIDQSKALLQSKVDTLQVAIERLTLEFESGSRRLDQIDDNLIALKEREDKLKADQAQNDEKLAEKERKLEHISVNYPGLDV